MNMTEIFPNPPIVIGGSGRSGTSLLLSILSSHPKIHVIPHETHAFCPTAYSQPITDLNAPFNFDGISSYFLNAKISPNCTRFCEKTPKNILFFGRILDFFGENVRLINIVRDGRDVITSRHPQRPDSFFVHPEQWIEDVKAGLPYDSHPQVLLVKYEDLIMNYKETIGKICNFIDEEIHPNMDNWINYTSVKKHSAWNSNVKDIHSESIGKWKNNEFRERLELIMSYPEAVSLLKHYGYLPTDAQAEGLWRPKFILNRIKNKLPKQYRLKLSNIKDFLSKKVHNLLH